jgi:hypothetical protein
MIPLWFIFSCYELITLFPLIQCVSEKTDSNGDTSNLYLEVAILARIPDTVAVPERRQ